MAKVTYQGMVLAESAQFEVVEGNIYFPPESVNMTLLSDSSHNTTCPWKGEASYYSLKAGETTVHNVAWYYPDPSDAAKKITNHVAFYKNKVTIEA